MKTASKTKSFTSTFRILFLCAFISCGILSKATAQKLTFNPKTTANGLIFGSFTFPKEKARFNGYYMLISYKSTDPKLVRKYSKEVHFIPAQITRMRHKGDLDGGLTYLFAVEKPEGEYAITNIRLFSNSGFQVLQKTSNINGFTIPFKVNKGEIQYIGNILFNEYAENGEPFVSYQNNFEKDLAGIRVEEPYVFWDAAKNDDTIKLSFDKAL
ncbi:hypothetical protein [Flavobacterium sp. ASV13]|uniref:hypothetical protein n=1 Tax=Flavobacterium sp. ASV13 TaxID=1506583 RepID=UPI000557FA97|nr:hypothetical protein [Flavobacterium sp. ASV13]